MNWQVGHFPLISSTSMCPIQGPSFHRWIILANVSVMRKAFPCHDVILLAPMSRLLITKYHTRGIAIVHPALSVSDGLPKIAQKVKVEYKRLSRMRQE